VAEDTAAARDRVLAARAELAEQVVVLEASGRAALDIPARIRRSPGKVAAVAGGIGFLALKGPQRIFGVARRAVRGGPAPLPKSMLPDEIEKTLRSLGKDGDKVRGTLERDFADYAKRSRKQRDSVVTVLLLAIARPILARAARTVADTVMTPDGRGFAERMEQVRARFDEAKQQAADSTAATLRPSTAPPALPSSSPAAAPRSTSTPPASSPTSPSTAAPTSPPER
jgi:hypothetical protein